MDKHSDFMEPVTPKLPFNWSAEDSGYHTSFTPGSLEYSDVADENYYPLTRSTKSKAWHYYVEESKKTPELNFKNVQSVKSTEGSKELSPPKRRGTKRSHSDETDNTDIGYRSILTPTSNISGELNRLRFSDSKKCNRSYNSSIEYSSSLFSQHDPCPSDSHYYATIPTTPIKKICKNGCKINSPETQHKLRRSLSMVMHSITCDKNALELKVTSEEKKPNTFHKYNVKPHQKIDIIKMLHQKANVLPPIMKIFSYLSHEDIFNFTLVSQDWQKVWEDVSEKKRQEEYSKYLNDIRESQENIMSTPKLREPQITRPLMEIQNVCNKNMAANTPVSPSKSPRTIRFKRFTKAASLDSRKQLPCMKCQLPAKIIEEMSGEEWAECTNHFCSFQFCSLCKSPRHPGKKCVQFDLDGPSPSKRIHRKDKCVAGSKKSKQKLKRLNF
ncbi:uncharacterized protein LOC121730109 [Aricia agestis]|uniref:uncharacterized protein LOC121730109 n=1 Tax=Aricia agestis TaxID=91739 RepID=UPI001C206746|nr:uncharacterized protein LOC121730109 [Aricia agestis]